MYSPETQKRMNCNHNISLFFEGKFVKDDYCDNCLDAISHYETELSIKRE